MRSRMGVARAAGLGALAACGLMVPQGRIAEAQQRGTTSNAGDTTREARPGSQAGAYGSQDSRLIMAHALEMAIEGSSLQSLAMQPALMSAAPAGNAATGTPRPGSSSLTPSETTPTIGSRAGTPSASAGNAGTTAGAGTPGTGLATGTSDPGTAATRVGPNPASLSTPVTGTGGNAAGTGFPDSASRPSIASPGTGFTGVPGETVSGRPVTAGTGAIATTPTPSATGGVGTTPAAAVGGTTRTGGTAGLAAPNVNIRDASALQQHADASFQAGERLLVQAGREANHDRVLFMAANRYLATLRNLATQSPERAGASGISASDLASIALINHAVMESIGAMKIRQLTRTIGSSDSPAAQVLLTHAREMDEQSRAMMQAFAGPVAAAVGPTPGIPATGVTATGEPAPLVAARAGIVPTLAQQAGEIILAMQGVGADNPGLPR